MGEDTDTYDDLATILPEPWREKTKEPGALPRPREIKRAAGLLKLILRYVTEGHSFGNTLGVSTPERGLAPDQESYVYPDG